jgi:orotidine-5'-phosphate decarboxylase
MTTELIVALDTADIAQAAAGADWIVVGRPITGAPDPAAAAAMIAREIAWSGSRSAA